jgi:hypothetical protein
MAANGERQHRQHHDHAPSLVVGPGEKALTRMLSAATSAAQVRLSSENVEEIACVVAFAAWRCLTNLSVPRSATNPRPPVTMLGVGAPRCGSARSVILPGGLLNSSMTACSGVGEPIARTLPDSLSPTTSGLDDARVALSLQQEHFERVRRLPRFAREVCTKPQVGLAGRQRAVAGGAALTGTVQVGDLVGGIAGRDRLIDALGAGRRRFRFA